MAHQHFVHVSSGNAGTFDGGSGRDRTEFSGMHVLERPAEPANWCTGGAKNNHVAHIHRVPIISNDCSNPARDGSGRSETRRKLRAPTADKDGRVGQIPDYLISREIAIQIFERTLPRIDFFATA
jgi:hypothetical protein